ncbi:MAG TPA: hypothetical protein PK691_00735 [Thermomicrobiales bacterium]|nr:hypothetical protein [Thermomicrobiales bacterium]
MSDREGNARYRRRSGRPAPPSDLIDEGVPRWAHQRQTVEDLDSPVQQKTRRLLQSKSVQRAAPARDGFLIGMAIAPALTSLVALAIASVPKLSGTGDVPAGIVLVLLFQVAAIAIVQQSNLSAWASSWISIGFLTSVMLPMLALQLSLLHEPFVSLELDSAGPALLATLLLLALYLSFAGWVAWKCQSRPEHAAVLLMPPTLAIPAMMGVHGTIDQSTALHTLSEIALLSALATAVVWLFPGWPQLLVGAAALAIELVRLWIAGNGPWKSETSGNIVNVVYVSMLVSAVVVIVMVPVADAMLQSRRTLRTRPRRRTR